MIVQDSLKDEYTSTHYRREHNVSGITSVFGHISGNMAVRNFGGISFLIEEWKHSLQSKICGRYFDASWLEDTVKNAEILVHNLSNPSVDTKLCPVQIFYKSERFFLKIINYNSTKSSCRRIFGIKMILLDWCSFTWLKTVFPLSLGLEYLKRIRQKI